jgi:hypothetical protein
MAFDPTISFGAILNAAALLLGFVVAFVRIGGRLDLLSLRLGSVEKALHAASDQDRRIATIEERLTNHVKMLTTAQRDISDMRHGEGFITRHRGTVDGEYP